MSSLPHFSLPADAYTSSRNSPAILLSKKPNLDPLDRVLRPQRSSSSGQTSWVGGRPIPFPTTSIAVESVKGDFHPKGEMGRRCSLLLSKTQRWFIKFLLLDYVISYLQVEVGYSHFTDQETELREAICLAPGCSTSSGEAWVWSPCNHSLTLQTSSVPTCWALCWGLGIELWMKQTLPLWSSGPSRKRDRKPDK